MAEYIEREAFLKDVEESMKSRGMSFTIGRILQRFIEGQPVADVVEVVRCKECLFSHEDPYCFYGYVCEKPLYFPVIGERPHRKPVQDSDYCSYGIRKRRDERK